MAEFSIHQLKEVPRFVFTHTAATLYGKLGWECIGQVRDPTGMSEGGEVLMKKDLG